MNARILACLTLLVAVLNYSWTRQPLHRERREGRRKEVGGRMPETEEALGARNVATTTLQSCREFTNINTGHSSMQPYGPTVAPWSHGPKGPKREYVKQYIGKTTKNKS